MTSAMPTTDALSAAAVELLDGIDDASWSDLVDLAGPALGHHSGDAEALRTHALEFADQAGRLSPSTPLWRVVLVDGSAGLVASTLPEYARHAVEVEAQAGDNVTVVRGIDLLRRLLVE